MEVAVVILVGGIAVQLLLALYMIAFYRIAGIRPTRLETRRWTVIFGWLILLVVVDAALVGGGIDFIGAFTLTVLLVGLPAMLASYFLRGRHWLFTLMPDEAAALEGRREAMNAAWRKPASWLLIGVVLVLVPVVSVLIILGFALAQT